MNYIVIGCGITGAVISRELANEGNSVYIFEKRNHIAGNMFDYIDNYGFLVQKYGPHIFHTNNNVVEEYVKRYQRWNKYSLVCGASWDGKYTKTPFNFSTIDTFFDKQTASKIKNHLEDAYHGQKTATVVDLLNNRDEVIRNFAQFLFDNDYAPYTAKQWGMNPNDVDPTILKRVPIRLSYEEGYFSDSFEAMPAVSFTNFVQNIISHEKIKVFLNEDAKNHISFKNNNILWDNKILNGKVIYTGPLDELFDYEFGKLPYRSLSFEWKHVDSDSFQEAPVVAYPKEQGYTRITEYKKLPPQKGEGTTIAIEYPRKYIDSEDMEPYYPVLTIESSVKYKKYEDKANTFKNLVLCGRLADFKYYNMDQAISRALDVFKQQLSKG